MKAAPKADDAPPKAKSKMMLIIIIVVILAAAGGGGAWFMMKGGDEAHETGGAKKTKKASKSAPPEYVVLEQFVVNLQQPQINQPSRDHLNGDFVSLIPVFVWRNFGESGFLRSQHQLEIGRASCRERV